MGLHIIKNIILTTDFVVSFLIDLIWESKIKLKRKKVTSQFSQSGMNKFLNLPFVYLFIATCTIETSINKVTHKKKLRS